MRGRNAGKNEKALHDSFIQSAVDNAVASAQAQKAQENRPQSPKHNPNIYQVPVYDTESELRMVRPLMAKNMKNPNGRFHPLLKVVLGK